MYSNKLVSFIFVYKIFLFILFKRKRKSINMLHICTRRYAEGIISQTYSTKSPIKVNKQHVQDRLMWIFLGKTSSAQFSNGCLKTKMMMTKMLMIVMMMIMTMMLTDRKYYLAAKCGHCRCLNPNPEPCQKRTSTQLDWAHARFWYGRTNSSTMHICLWMHKMYVKIYIFIII